MTTANRAPGEETGVLPARGGGAAGALDLDATFRKALPHVVAMARRRGLNEDEQHEIAQRVGVILVVRKGAYDPAQGTPVEWAIGIAKNVFREARRADRTMRRAFEQVPLAGLESRPSEDLTPEERARAHAALGIIQRALTDQERKVLALTVEGCAAKEVADILDLPVTTVEFRLKMARARLAAALKRLGEDENSVTNVRGAALPLMTVEDIEHAWRARVDRGLSRPVSRRGVLSAGRPGAIRSALYTTSIIAGIALVGPGGPVTDRQASVAAEPSAPPDVTAAATGVPAAPAPTAPAVQVARVPAPAPAARAAVLDPATASEGLLLQMALSAAPARAYGLASLHARRFPSQSVQKREMILVRSLVALGRRDEAVPHARALEGTMYEKQAEDALGGAPR